MALENGTPHLVRINLIIVRPYEKSWHILSKLLNGSYEKLNSSSTI